MDAKAKLIQVIEAFIREVTNLFRGVPITRFIVVNDDGLDSIAFIAEYDTVIDQKRAIFAFAHGARVVLLTSKGTYVV